MKLQCLNLFITTTKIWRISVKFHLWVPLIVAYDIDGIILHHAVPSRQTVNAAYYYTFLLHHLHPALRRKRRHLVVQNTITLHDNARSHTAAAVTDLLRRWQWEILEHTPYIHPMSPCDYGLFAKVKEPLRGTLYSYRAVNTEYNNDGRADGTSTFKHLANVINKEG